MKHNKGNIFKSLISLIILAVIICQLDFQAFTTISFKVNGSVITILLVLFLSSCFLRALRWQILMNDKHVSLNILVSIKLLFIGTSLNMVLPSGVGDIAKSYFGYKWTGMKERMVAISLIDKLIAIGSILFLTPLAFYYSGNLTILLAGLLSILPFLFLYYFDFFNKYKLFNVPFKFMSNKIKKIDLELLMSHMKLPTSKIIFSFLISIAAWLITYALLFFCLKIVGLSIPLGLIIAAIPFLTLGRLFPFTLNGIGSDEVLILYLFSNNEFQKEPILIAALLYRLILMILPAIIGLPFILKNKKFNEAKI